MGNARKRRERDTVSRCYAVRSVPRYELDGDVWQIVQGGTQIEITSGGKTAIRKFVKPEHADAAAAKLVAEKLAAGYQLVLGEPREAALEAAIAAEPEVPAAYSVYADWLQAQGEPRGTVMALQIAAETGDARLATAWKQELAKHAHQLLGPLAQHAVRVDDIDVLEWRFGFIHRAYLRGERAAILGPLLAHPSGRFLVELALINDEQAPVDELVQHAPASLRALRLVARGGLDLQALWPEVPRLRRLSLTGRALGLGVLALPELQRLQLADDQLAGRTARMIAKQPWPKLQQLKIDFGQGVLTGNASVDEVLDLLNRTDLPALTHVAIVHAKQISDLVKDLPASAVAPQLEVLDLSFAHMTDAHAIELARHHDSLPRLTHLDVSGNRLTSRGLAALRGMATTIAAGNQLT
jgi:uncharacterized protein (TIGR02996 family)